MRNTLLGTGIVLAVALGFAACEQPSRLPAVTAVGGETEASPTRHVRPPEPRIVHLDERFDALVAPEAAVEWLGGEFEWLEGPVWNREHGFLLFSDIPRNTVYRWRPMLGFDPYLSDSGYSGAEPFTGREPGSNGLTYDSQGRLVLCEHGNRRITRLENNGSRTVLADRYRGRRLNSPNDAVYASTGALYFTDPPFGLPRAFQDPARELNHSGIYRLSPDGDLILLTDALRAPNGIAFSPDESQLYVTDVDPERPAWYVFDVEESGLLGQGRVFQDALQWTRERPGGPDGLKVDIAGNLFGAGPGGVYVFAPDSSHLGTFDLGVATGNLAWGDDGSVLYVTAGTSVYRVPLRTRGAALPGPPPNR